MVMCNVMDKKDGLFQMALNLRDRHETAFLDAIDNLMKFKPISASL